MIFLQNFGKKSSRFWKFFKKLSKVTQSCASNPLTSYFGFRTFWRVFVAKKYFCDRCWKNKCFFSLIIFLFEKRKIIKLQADLQRVICGIFARFGYRGSPPCSGEWDPHIGALRTCTQQAQEMQPSGTKFAKIGEVWRGLAMSNIQQKSRIYQNVFFHEKVRAKSYRTPFADFPNSLRLSLCISCRFWKNGGNGG